MAAAANLSSEVKGTVVTEDGRAIQGARVALFSYPPWPARLIRLGGRRGMEVGSVQSGVGGRFSLPASGGHMGLEARAPAFGTTLLEEVRPGADGQIGAVRLARASRIAGQVVDEQGRPVARADVEISRSLTEHVRSIVRLRTDLAGRFMTDEAPSRPTMIAVRAPGFRQFLAVDEAGLKQQLSVSLLHGIAISGRVVDADMRPASHALVFSGPITTRADGGGRFTLRGLDPGPMVVEARHATGAGRIDVWAGRHAGVMPVIRLFPASGIQGTVVDVLSRAPIGGARVELVEVSVGAGAFVVRGDPELRPATITDQRGRFRLSSVHPGRTRLSVSKRGYVPASVPALDLNAGHTAVLAVALEPLATVAGTVVDGVGLVIASAEVFVHPPKILRASPPSGGLHSGPPAEMETVRTDEHGRFEVSVPASSGFVSLAAAAAGYAPSSPPTLRLSPGERRSDVLLRLTPQAVAQGRVVSEASGRPIATVWLRAQRMTEPGLPGAEAIEPGLPGAEAISDLEGRFFLGGLRAGTYLIELRHPDFGLALTAPVHVESGQVVELPTLALSPQVAIDGVVRDSAGDAIQGTDIFAYSDAGAVAPVRTDARGRFVVTGFAAGQAVTIGCLPHGYDYVKKTVTAPAHNVVLSPPSTGTLRGRVMDGMTGRAIPGFRIVQMYMEPSDATPGVPIPEERSFYTENGRFVWMGVFAGRWTLAAAAPGYRPRSLTVEVPAAGQTPEVVFALDPGRAVEGLVRNALTGAPIANALVRGTLADGAELLAPWQATDAEGRFRLDGLPPGSVVLSASAPSFLEANREVTANDGVELELVPESSIQGRIDRPEARPLRAPILVRLERLRGDGQVEEELAAATDIEGNFGFGGLAPGRYRIAAGHGSATELTLAPDDHRSGLELSGGS